MKYLRIKLLVLLLCVVATSFADDFPWKKYGLNPKVLTLSKGKYKEFHDMETVVQIGSVYFNTETRKIVGFVKKDTTSKVLSMDAHTVSRWFSPDPLSEEYSSWSPYNYVMNNPVIFIDPDGRDVHVYKMGKSRNAGFKKYMATATGRAYVAQFLKKNESVHGYNFTATNDGKYSNSTVRFFATSSLDKNTVGRSYAFTKNEDGSRGKRILKPDKSVTEKDMATLQNTGSFEIGIALNGSINGRSSAQWAETIGHEAFIHSDNNAEAVATVIKALNSGVSLNQLYDLIVTLNKVAISADKEHDDADNGKNKNYNNYRKERKENDEKE